MFDKYLTKTGRLSPNQPQEVKNQWYIQRFREIHGDKYDYSQVVYTGQLDHVTILCTNHGHFSQRVSNHLAGQGCQKCHGNNLKSKEGQIKDFIAVHGTRYIYDRVEYINSTTQIEIICKIHGVFSQLPQDHISGRGCPKCGKHNQNIVYVLSCASTGLVKIGITNNLKKRLQTLGGNLYVIAAFISETPRDLESQLHKRFKDYRIYNQEVRNGNTEFFKLTQDQVQQVLDILRVKAIQL